MHSATGQIAVIGTTEPFLHVLDSLGAPLFVGVRRGGGLAEFQTPWAVAAAQTSGEFAVVDVRSRGLRLVDAAGRVRPASPITLSRATILADVDRLTYGAVRATATTDAGHVVGDVSGQLTGTRGHRSLVVTHQRTDDVIDTLRTFGADSAYAELEDGPGDFFAPIPLWASCSASLLVIFDPERDSLTWIDPAGATVASRATGFASRPVTDADIERYLLHLFALEARNANVHVADADLRGMVVQRFAGSRSMFAVTAPPGTALVCTASGWAWLNDFDTANDARGYAQTWNGFDQAGGARLTLRVRDVFRPVTIDDRQAIGIDCDSLDVARVARTRIVAARVPE